MVTAPPVIKVIQQYQSQEQGDHKIPLSRGDEERQDQEDDDIYPEYESGIILHRSLVVTGRRYPLVTVAPL